MWNRVKSNYEIARDNIKKAREDYDKAIHDFRAVIDAINYALLHGQKEESLIKKMKFVIANVNDKSLAYQRSIKAYRDLQRNGVIYE